MIAGDLDIVVVLDCEDTTMPYHNNHNDSIVFMNTLINAVKGKGNLSFILTCYPNKLYTNLSDVSWIYEAQEIQILKIISKL